MRWLPLLLLTPCTPEMLAADDPIAASWLEDGAEAGIAERAYLGTYGEARLTADGEPFEGAPWDEAYYTPGRSLAVVEPGDGALRVVYEDRLVRMLVWLDRADFVPVVHEGARAVAAPGRRQGRSGVWLKPGHVVTEPVAGWAQATFSDPVLQGEVFVAGREVDAYWVEPPAHEPEEADEIEAPDAYLRGGGAILDAPGGEVLARTGDFDEYWIEATRLDERDGWTEIEVGNAEVRVVGWVPSDDLAEHATGGMGWSSCGVGWGTSGGYGWVGEWDSLAPGTELRGDDGALVGVTIAEMKVHLTEDEEGGLWFDRDTPWGTARLWL